MFGPIEAQTKPLKPGDVFKDCPVCPEMVVIPAGSFMMGHDQPDEHIHGDDFVSTKPVRRVTIKLPFAMGRYEVTVEEFQACMDDALCWLDGANLRRDTKPRMPVVKQTYIEALGFLHWLKLKTGRQYRLPSEAEWEYAARGGATTRYWWGDAMEYGRANCGVCLPREEKRGLRVVGSFPPNPFGLYDMLGNVDEWVADCWNDSYEGAPADGAPRTDGDCTRGTGRGADWNSRLTYTPVFDRGWNLYLKRDKDGGFRVVRDLTDEELGLTGEDKP
ncbi:formylglycine-generating enzyme family protein [Magnetospira sp. QH-2]|uniref:formylglycine-generating enzyme family protein n=1 Tax=Magnetospira sp. (strain QH-2) TaxID=1288970 RepID=UPI0006972C9A|nr:formylglycine-generating enzyme family protein [Magnetospira sp. QH-2]